MHSNTTDLSKMTPVLGATNIDNCSEDHRVFVDHSLDYCTEQPDVVYHDHPAPVGTDRVAFGQFDPDASVATMLDRASTIAKQWQQGGDAADVSDQFDDQGWQEFMASRNNWRVEATPLGAATNTPQSMQTLCHPGNDTGGAFSVVRPVAARRAGMGARRANGTWS